MSNYKVTFNVEEWATLLAVVTMAEYDAQARKNARLAKSVSRLRDKLAQREVTE